MKRIVSAIITSTAFLGAHAASAQTFTTTPGIYTFAGRSVAVQKGNGPLLSCNLSISIVNDGTDIYAESVDIDGDFGLCFTISFGNVHWPVTVSGSTVRIDNIHVNTNITPGDCAGFLDATFSTGSTAEQLFLETGFYTPSTLPQVFSGGDCKIDGILEY